MKRESDINPLEVFRTFALYGYRKTSMASIADAIGMSRQGVYKRFNSKEELFDWMVGSMVEAGLASVVETLADDGKPLPERLSAVFDSWSGQFIEVLRSSPHAGEILDRITADAKASQSMSDSLISLVTKLLIAENAVSHEARAHDCAFTLYAASKGLALMAENRRDFNEGMRKAIHAVLGT